MASKASEYEKIKHKPLFLQMLKIGLPLLVAQAVSISYNIVDRLFISGLKSDSVSNLGELAFSGLSVCFPVILIISAFAAMIGGGGMAVVAIKLGENDKENAQKTLKNCFILAIIFCAALAGLIFIFKKPILFAFGAGKENFPYANEYLSYYLLGSPLIFLSLVMVSFVTAQGSTKVSLLAISAGAVLKIAIAPLFIFTFNLGVKGAAISTIISQSVSFVILLWFLLSKKSYLRLKIDNLKLNGKIIKKVLAIGLSPFTFQAMEAVVQIVLFYNLKKYAASDYVSYQAAMGFIVMISQIAIFPVMGFNQGTQSLLGYNFGAKNFENFKKIMRLSFIFTSAIFAGLFILILIFAPSLASLITKTSDTAQIAAKGLRVYWLAMPLLGVLLTIQIAFMAMGKAKTSFLIALLRKLALLVPLVFVLPVLFGINGIFFASPSADLITAIVAVFLMLTAGRKVLRLD